MTTDYDVWSDADGRIVATVANRTFVLQAEPQEAARLAEVVVGGRRQQMHAGGVAAHQHQDIALEAVPVDAVTQLDACDQVRFAGQQILDRHGGEPWVGGGV